MKLRSLIILILSLIILFNCKNATDTELEHRSFRNGDFEEGTTTPSYWEIHVPDVFRSEGGNALRWRFDTETAYSGNRSVQSSRIPGYSLSTQYSYFRQLITDFSTDDEISFSGYIKYDNIGEGTASLAIEFLGKDDKILKIVALDNFIQGLREGWKNYSVTSSISSGTQKIYVYCIHDGDGIVWFDNTAVSFE